MCGLRVSFGAWCLALTLSLALLWSTLRTTSKLELWKMYRHQRANAGIAANDGRFVGRTAFASFESQHAFAATLEEMETQHKAQSPCDTFMLCFSHTAFVPSAEGFLRDNATNAEDLHRDSSGRKGTLSGIRRVYRHAKRDRWHHNRETKHIATLTDVGESMFDLLFRRLSSLARRSSLPTSAVGDLSNPSGLVHGWHTCGRTWWYCTEQMILCHQISTILAWWHKETTRKTWSDSILRICVVSCYSLCTVLGSWANTHVRSGFL